MREYKFRAFHKGAKEMLFGANENIFRWQSEGQPIEIMQFTGLKDLQGKEIYEGDIVDYGNGRNKVVEFIDGCFCICGITAMPKLMTLYPVIGNIYENPELLK